MSLADAIKWNDDGLVCAIVQDKISGAVLMQAWMDREALEATLSTGTATFWSRSRQQLWVKGETSGNTQTVLDVRLDCDGDAVLLLVEPAGPACHTGAPTCFFRQADGDAWRDAETADVGMLSHLGAIIAQRKSASAQKSYVASLFEAGRDRILRKIGEESVETILAAKGEDRDELVHELADLWFHTLVLLADADLSPGDVTSELAGRLGVSGHDEKAARQAPAGE